MKKAEREVYRERLELMRARLTGDVHQLTEEALNRDGSGNLSSMTHMADVGTDNFEQDFALTLLQSEEETLHQIQGALKRIEEGVYGSCAICGKSIPKSRLQAIPYAEHCVKCARQQEMEGEGS